MRVNKKASAHDTLSAYTIKNEVNILTEEGKQKTLVKGDRDSYMNLDLGSED